MRCKSCDYPLWNLKARQCPECGAAFRPSEYEFEANSVRFCCPHCDQPYFGTGETGHPVPESFGCLRCGQPVHIDEMVLRPGLGVEEAKTARLRMPWLERKEIGFFKSWFMMIGYAMTRPVDLGRSIPRERSAWGAWLYATVTLLIFTAIGILLPQGLVFGLAGRAPWRSFSLAPLQTAASIVIGVAAAAFAVGALVWLWAIVAHGILRLTGGGVEPLRRTGHALYYSAGAGVLTVAPCFGSMIGWIWWAISATIMLKEIQGVRTIRAACAILAAPVLVWGALLGFYIVVMIITMSGGFAVSPAGNSTTQLNWAILSYAQQHAGSGPAHAIELHTASQVGGFAASSPGAFTFPDSQTTDVDIPVGDGSFADFMKASRSEQFSAIADMIDSMPKGVVAHRFGDYVFTYHGATLFPADPKLWIFVMLPDPACNPTPGPDDPIYIGVGGYQVTEATFSELPELLRQQNRHRASLKLPPLPDLASITHDKPAVAPSASDDGKDQEAQ